MLLVINNVVQYIIVEKLIIDNHMKSQKHQKNMKSRINS